MELVGAHQVGTDRKQLVVLQHHADVAPQPGRVDLGEVDPVSESYKLATLGFRPIYYTAATSYTSDFEVEECHFILTSSTTPF